MHNDEDSSANFLRKPQHAVPSVVHGAAAAASPESL